MTQRWIKATYYRGGTSKGVFFQKKDLPTENEKELNELFLKVIGSPDPNGRQLNGMGGGVSSVLAFMDSPKHETSYTLIMEFASGAIGTIDATYCGPEGLFDDRVEVVGTDALVEAIGCEALFEGFASGPDLRVWRNGAWKYYETSDTWDASVKRSVSSFFDAVAREEQPPVDGNLGRQVLQIIEAAYISATEGRRVLL